MTAPYLALSLARLRSQVKQLWPSRATGADGWIGDAAHQAGVSDHNPDPKTGVVRALDLTATKAQADRILEATINDPRVHYVIYNRNIWVLGRKRAYTGSNPHSGHVHISIKHSIAAETNNSDWKGLGMAYAVSPMEGRFTSGFNPNRYITLNGKRVFSPHGGIDIAPHKVGEVGTPVYAMFAGRVTRTISNRKPGQAASVGSTLHTGISGNGTRVDNPDGEFQIYSHVRPAVKVGDKVKAGDLVGHTDRSGIQTGPHLHLGTYTKNGVAYDPMIVFNKYGIKPGEKPNVSKGDWLSMVSKKELREVVQDVVHKEWYKAVTVHGATKRVTGKETLSRNTLLRYAAAAYINEGEHYPILRAEIRALKEAVEILANSQGVSGADVLDTVDKALRDFLGGYSLEGKIELVEELEGE